MLRILYDDFDQKVDNIHDEMDIHHSYKRKACMLFTSFFYKNTKLWLFLVKKDVFFLNFMLHIEKHLLLFFINIIIINEKKCF